MLRLLTAFRGVQKNPRYIHQNPVKAGLAAGLNYKWSSYSWYISGNKDARLLPDLENLLGMLSVNRNNAVKSFKAFHDEEEVQVFFDVVAENENDEDTESILEKFLSQYRIKELDLKKVENRDLAIKLVKNIVHKTGMPGRQVAALTGLNREIVRKIIMSIEPSP